jgi:gluconolactonase
MQAIDRRSFLAGLGGAALVANAAQAQTVHRDWSGKEPTRYPDPDVIVLDKSFAKYKVGNTPIQRLATGMLWAEGLA